MLCLSIFFPQPSAPVVVSDLTNKISVGQWFVVGGQYREAGVEFGGEPMNGSNISVLRLLAPSKIASYKVNWSKMRLSARGPVLKALSGIR